MAFPPVLVTGMTGAHDAALLLLDLEDGTARTLLPYRLGGVDVAAGQLYAARVEGDRTRLEAYDREGLAWMRRVPTCSDTHSLVVCGDRVALCSTGTNEIVVLDRHGTEIGRWSPDGAAEGDSWHLNSLTCHQGRPFVTCFGRFPEFRGWSGHVEDAGLLLELETERAVLRGLSAPHDPRRLEGGWLVNEAARSRTLYFPDAGPAQVVAELPGFARGLAVLPDVYVIGFSAHRLSQRESDRGGVVLVDRRTHQILKTIPIPYREVGHILPAPPADLLAAVRREQSANRHCLLESAEEIGPADRAGYVAVLSPFQPSSDRPEVYAIRLRVANHGKAAWSHDNRLPIGVSFEVLDRDGCRQQYSSQRLPLPLSLLPGRTLTFEAPLDLGSCRHDPAAAAVRITLVQERVAWWEPTEAWTPAVVELPSDMRDGHVLAALAEARDHGAALQQQLGDLRVQFDGSQQALQQAAADLEQTRARLASYEDLGPLTLSVARQLRRTARRFPRTSALLKRLLRSAA